MVNSERKYTNNRYSLNHVFQYTMVFRSTWARNRTRWRAALRRRRLRPVNIHDAPMWLCFILRNDGNEFRVFFFSFSFHPHISMYLVTVHTHIFLHANYVIYTREKRIATEHVYEWPTPEPRVYLASLIAGFLFIIFKYVK